MGSRKYLLKILFTKGGGIFSNGNKSLSVCLSFPLSICSLSQPTKMLKRARNIQQLQNNAGSQFIILLLGLLVCHMSEVKRKSLSHVQLFVTPWTIESMEFSRPEYWSGWLFPSPGDLPNPGIKTALWADSSPAEPQNCSLLSNLVITAQLVGGELLAQDTRSSSRCCVTLRRLFDLCGPQFLH